MAAAANENTHGWLRPFFPKSTAVAFTHSRADLDEAKRQLTSQPRQSLTGASRVSD